MSGYWRALVRGGVPLLGAVLFALALIALRRQLASHHWSEITRDLRNLSAAAIGRAALLTGASYTVMVGYDALALEYVRKRIRPLQVAFASFVAYSLSQTLGFALFTGGAVRYRFWSSWGLSAGEIGRAVGFNAVTFSIGIVALVGAAMVADPASSSQLLHLHPVAMRLLGSGLLLAVAGYFALTALRRAPVQWFGLRFEVPGPGLAASQILVSCLDWTIAAGVLFVLLPSAPGLGFPAFVGLFTLALVAGLVSHVPGGLGVFDSLIVFGLAPYANPAQVVGSLVAFRGIYFLGPFLLGSVALLWAEAVRHRAGVAGAARWAWRWVPSVVPYALSFLVLGGGIMLLVSGAAPEEPSRLRLLGEIFPLSVIEASHFIGSLAGMALVILGWGLTRRLDGAWLLTMVFLGVGATAALLRGVEVMEAGFLLLILLVLLPSRRRFYRRTRLLAEP